MLWELGPEILPDQFERNNKMATATPLKLAPTETQTSIERNNLTLHGHDVDFFEIEFQSNSVDMRYEAISEILEGQNSKGSLTI